MVRSLKSTYLFADPNSSNPNENALKLYLDLGNLITESGALDAFEWLFYDNVKTNIEPSFFGNLQSVEGDFQVGGNLQGTLGSVAFLDASGQSTPVSFEANASLISLR